ncbi:MAG: hypothetical protein KGY42_00395 [Desulfobacterales bacterium]|nr:hypothetical protein [Desulfobacterales bacterium]MBS3756441.1 hypothetical protein [Desulfobacterales bacterium]
MPDDFSRLEWILKNSIQPGYEIRAPQQVYGDLTEINECRVILDAAVPEKKKLRSMPGKRLQEPRQMCWLSRMMQPCANWRAGYWPRRAIK